MRALLNNVEVRELCDPILNYRTREDIAGARATQKKFSLSETMR